MDRFKKLDYIEKLYTRECTKKDLESKLKMKSKDVTIALHLKNFFYGIKRNPNNISSNCLCTGILSTEQLEFLDKYDINCKNKEEEFYEL